MLVRILNQRLTPHNTANRYTNHSKIIEYLNSSMLECLPNNRNTNFLMGGWHGYEIMEGRKYIGYFDKILWTAPPPPRSYDIFHVY